MVETGGDREKLLRREYLSQTARIAWRELQPWFARGNMVAVAADLDLIEVAVQLGTDNTSAFQGWLEEGRVTRVADEQARTWNDAEQELWAVVAPPWVLVQQRD
jgi:hypothetical protein